jgi:uncharacterized Zn finger protein
MKSSFERVQEAVNAYVERRNWSDVEPLVQEFKRHVRESGEVSYDVELLPKLGLKGSAGRHVYNAYVRAVEDYIFDREQEESKTKQDAYDAAVEDYKEGLWSRTKSNLLLSVGFLAFLAGILIVALVGANSDNVWVNLSATIICAMSLFAFAIQVAPKRD